LRVDTLAVVLDGPEQVALRRLALQPAGNDEVVVDVAFSGISAGTERLMWSGAMPPFPGMGYPLVPGYEAVGRIVDAQGESRSRIGETVFVPGSTAFVGARGLFGGAARRIIAPSVRATALPEGVEETGVLIALAATARHAIAAGSAPPDVIVGHGVLGRLLARIAIAEGYAAPIVWEIDPLRRSGGEGYRVIDPDDDRRSDYRVILDASGAHGLLDQWIGRLAKGGEVVLAGFYHQPLQFAFPPAFMREARLRIAAEWAPEDLQATIALIREGRLSLSGLITHRQAASEAEAAYRAAFSDSRCLKMVLDWSACA